jgi:hypothetical protein
VQLRAGDAIGASAGSMDHLAALAAALCALSLLSAALQLTWLTCRVPASAADERRLRTLKIFRSVVIACIAASQDVAGANLAEQRQGDATHVALGNLVVAASWSLAAVGPSGGRLRAQPPPVLALPQPRPSHFAPSPTRAPPAWPVCSSSCC